MRTSFPLTASGIGIVVEQPDVSFFQKENIEKLLHDYQFIACKKVDWNLEQIHSFMQEFGDLVRNEKRKDNTMLTLNGSAVNEVLRGHGRFPLHRDGLLMNNAVKYVLIYCLGFDVTKGGKTFISDNEKAWTEVPEEIKNALRKNGFEIKPYDNNYYLKNEDRWYAFPGVACFENKEFLNGGLSHWKDEPKSYELRIKNVDENLSEQYYTTLENIIMQDKYTYYHQWDKGDFLMFDNRRVLHGREAFEGERSLIQLQVKD